LVDGDEPCAHQQARARLAHPFEPQEGLDADGLTGALQARLPPSNHVGEAVVPGLVAERLELARVRSGRSLQRLQHANRHARSGRHSPERVTVGELSEQQRPPEAGTGGRFVGLLGAEAGLVVHDVDVLYVGFGVACQLELRLGESIHSIV
jgi:hypothetical protein